MDVQDKELGRTQSKMHGNFFDRARAANEKGFYLEAIFLEYAAIEGRLEVILGMLGLPCNKELDSNTRKSINISSRVSCLNKYRKNCPSLFEKTKLEYNFFSPRGELNKWLKNRNTFVHGLYKDAHKYLDRSIQSKEDAETGLELARRLYNEAARIRRLYKSHPELFEAECRNCHNKKCVVSTIKED